MTGILRGLVQISPSSRRAALLKKPQAECVCDDNRAEHIQHGESGLPHKDLQKSPNKGHEWSVIEPLGIPGSEVTSESKIEDLLNGLQPEPEEEGDTRVRVAFSSKKWFEVEIRLNGQRH